MLNFQPTGNSETALPRPMPALLRLVPLSLLVLIVLNLFLVSVADLAAKDLDAEGKRVVRSIVTSVGGMSGVDRALKVLGFQPENFVQRETWQGYRGWPDIRKLEGAYHAAEAKVPESGGDLLNDMLMLTAKENLAITADRAFLQNIGQVSSHDLRNFRPRRFTFGLPTAKQLDVALPRQMKEIVRAVTRHARHIPGGMPSLVRACCGQSPEAVYRIMRTAETYEEVLTWALKEGEIPPELHRRLQNLVEHGLKHNVALAYDEALMAAAEELRPIGKSRARPPSLKPRVEQDATVLPNTEPERALARIVQQAGGGQLPEGVELLTQDLQGALTADSTLARFSTRIATQQYVAFLARHYDVLPSRIGDGKTQASDALNFAKVRVRASGFGGVVLGNDIAAETDIPRPLRFKWRPLDDRITEARSFDPKFTWGYLMISFEDGSVGVTLPMRAQHVWSAATIVYTGLEGVVAPLEVGDGTNGEAVGLVGFVGRRDYNFLEDGQVRKVVDGARAFVLHPAILGYRLADDALLVDAAPFSFRKELEDMVRNWIDQRGDDASEKDWEMFETWLNDGDRTTYKFVDTPLTIMRANSGVMYAVRTESDTHRPHSLRNRAFLTFQKFDGKQKPAKEDSPPFFYPFVPLLIEAWPNFERLNDFAEVLAFFRWLRAKDAAWEVGLKEPQRGPALTTLIMKDKEQPRLARSPFEINYRLAERVHEVASTLLENAPQSLIHLNDKVHQARLDRLAAREAQQIWDDEPTANGLGMAERILSRTDEGEFLYKLKEMENDAAQRSPLHKLLDKLSVEWEEIGKEHTKLSERVKMLNPEQDAGNELREEVLLRWIATETERKQIEEADRQIAALNTEISNDTTGWFPLFLAWWNRGRIQNNRDERDRIQSNRVDMIEELRKRRPEVSARLSNKVSILAERIETLSPIFTTPRFKDWRALQLSYRDEVFGK